LVKPSMRMTTTIITVDTIPKIEVYDSSDKGRNTVGINLIPKLNEQGEFQRMIKLRTRATPRPCRYQMNIGALWRAGNQHIMLQESH